MARHVRTKAALRFGSASKARLLEALRRQGIPAEVLRRAARVAEARG
jgi:hypothetical protein